MILLEVHNRIIEQAIRSQIEAFVVVVVFCFVLFWFCVCFFVRGFRCLFCFAKR